MISSLSIVGVALALGAPALSVIYWLRVNPRIFFRIAGEQYGDLILIQKNTRILFAVGTNSSGHINILNIAVYFDDNQVDLFQTKGINKEGSADRSFPMAIIYPEQKVVTKNSLQTNHFDMQSNADEFSLKIIVTAEPDHARLPFLLSVLPVRKIRKEKIVQFRVDQNLKKDMKKQGLMLKPGESFHAVGVQSQEGVSAVTSQGTATIDVREILDD